MEGDIIPIVSNSKLIAEIKTFAYFNSDILNWSFFRYMLVTISKYILQFTIIGPHQSILWWLADLENSKPCIFYYAIPISPSFQEQARNPSKINDKKRIDW